MGLCLNWLLGENLPKFLTGISPVLLGCDSRLGTGIIPDLALCWKTGPNFLWEFHQCCLELMLGWVLLVKFSGRYSTNVTSYWYLARVWDCVWTSFLWENWPKFLVRISLILLGSDVNLGSRTVLELAFFGKTDSNMLQEFFLTYVKKKKRCLWDCSNFIDWLLWLPVSFGGSGQRCLTLNCQKVRLEKKSRRAC